MTIRRALAGALVLVGGLTLMVTVLGMLGGNGALAPFAFLGLVLGGVGIRLLADPRRSRPGARWPRGGYVVAAGQPYAAPTGDVGWYGPADTDHSHRSPSSGHPGASDGAHHSGSDSGSSGSGWSGGGDSGSSGGGWSGGGDSGGWSGGGDSY
ncbi:hypothetical protein [Micromonospora inyonensis]|uniref:Uncharacterized protein n=1 Tax=Micromonospora inyonensis TaxID=47866 RepID=A0A1C6S0I9_9ACTN|nr:hypothetical protein [Micromonospora inyonensis]SCL22810.1 hypothetical protein GA0074694_3467 [Micromonospora inyonensis]